MSQRLVNKSELQGQGHGRGFAQKVRAALGGRPEASSGAHLVSERGRADVQGRGGDAGAGGGGGVDLVFRDRSGYFS